jgi:hypothetical protein
MFAAQGKKKVEFSEPLVQPSVGLNTPEGNPHHRQEPEIDHRQRPERAQFGPDLEHKVTSSRPEVSSSGPEAADARPPLHHQHLQELDPSKDTRQTLTFIVVY